MEHKVLESKTMYEGRVFTAKEEKVILPSGMEAIREITLHNGGASILAVDEDDNIVLIRQYRHAVGKYVLEIPAGALEIGEDPAVCAKRELQEETGYIAKNLKFLLKMHMSIGYSNEVNYIYLATDLTAGEQNLDYDEEISVEKYSLKDAVDMIYSGEITDSKTVAGILAWSCLNR